MKFLWKVASTTFSPVRNKIFMRFITLFHHHHINGLRLIGDAMDFSELPFYVGFSPQTISDLETFVFYFYYFST